MRTAIAVARGELSACAWGSAALYYGWTDRIGFAVPGRSPSVRYGQGEYIRSLYTLRTFDGVPLALVRARRAAELALRKQRFMQLRGLMVLEQLC